MELGTQHSRSDPGAMLALAFAECMQYRHRAELYARRVKTVNRKEEESAGSAASQMHQPCAGQILHRFEVLQGLVEVAPRDAGMLSRQGFGAHPFAMRNGVHDQAVLVGRNEKELPQFRGSVLPVQEGARRGERQANTRVRWPAAASGCAPDPAVRCEIAR